MNYMTYLADQHRNYSSSKFLCAFCCVWSLSNHKNEDRKQQAGRNNLLEPFEKLRKTTIIFVMSVSPSVLPHGTTRQPLDGYLLNLIFEYFSKLSRKFKFH